MSGGVFKAQSIGRTSAMRSLCLRADDSSRGDDDADGAVDVGAHAVASTAVEQSPPDRPGDGEFGVYDTAAVESDRVLAGSVSGERAFA